MRNVPPERILAPVPKCLMTLPGGLTGPLEIGAFGIPSEGTRR
jgi:hypothetical protein